MRFLRTFTLQDLDRRRIRWGCIDRGIRDLDLSYIPAITSDRAEGGSRDGCLLTRGKGTISDTRFQAVGRDRGCWPGCVQLADVALSSQLFPSAHSWIKMKWYRHLRTFFWVNGTKATAPEVPVANAAADSGERVRGRSSLVSCRGPRRCAAELPSRAAEPPRSVLWCTTNVLTTGS